MISGCSVVCVHACWQPHQRVPMWLKLSHMQAGLLQVPQVTLVGGGVPIIINGEVIGATGVGGAPAGSIDEEIATAGANVIA
jgi:uncharacterized protein GlcG (DUF336 family)